jgi:hypothetical protein
MGIEPTYAAWEAAVLPLNYARRVPCHHKQGVDQFKTDMIRHRF